MDKKSSTSNRLINISLGIIVIFLVVWVLIIGRTIILPFMIALFLTFILDPVVSLLTRWKIPVSLAVFLTILFAF
jgi:predicted PurR-regulated permease PerM